MDAIQTKGHVDELGNLVVDEPLDAEPGKYKIILLREDGEEIVQVEKKLTYYMLDVAPTDPSATYRRVDIYSDEE
jgi:hypothetical protein